MGLGIHDDAWGKVTHFDQIYILSTLFLELFQPSWRAVGCQKSGLEICTDNRHPTHFLEQRYEFQKRFHIRVANEETLMLTARSSTYPHVSVQCRPLLCHPIMAIRFQTWRTFCSDPCASLCERGIDCRALQQSQPALRARPISARV